MINDIYSFKKRKIKKKIEKRIIVDFREKNSLVPAELIKKGFIIEFKKLEIGDYLVKDFVIERKTKNDFIASIIDGRLKLQMREMQKCAQPFLILEEEIFQEKIHPNSIKGMICSILIEYKIPIIFSQNPKDTAEFMAILFNRSKKESPLIPKRKGLTKNEKIRRVIEAFPEIGPKNSKKLLEKFKTLKNIFSQEEEVKKILNKKSKNFFEILNGEYKIIENKKD